jgi:hypothetical protein
MKVNFHINSTNHKIDILRHREVSEGTNANLFLIVHDFIVKTKRFGHIFSILPCAWNICALILY